MTRNWFTDFNARMYTAIRMKLLDSLGDRYAGINIVRASQSLTPSELPTVYIQDPEKSSVGDTLDMTVPNGVTCMYQAEVYSKSREEAELLANAVEQVLFSMRFRPLTANREMDSGSPSIIRRVGTYKRDIGADDIL